MLPDNICFTEHPELEIHRLFTEKQYSSLTILVDHNTKEHCYPLLQDSLPEHTVIEVPGGEEYKTLETCTVIWQAMTDMHIDRHALVVVLGGGVLGDMGGFCAATYKRGVDFILVPTTLLAQVDASIGGKLGIDFNHYKNHIGVFQLPVLTILCSRFLHTLPERELRSGYAEVIKHILTSDNAMWNEIKKRTLHEQNWERLIEHSVKFKAHVVTEDPREKGLRKILNAGHTIGHAFESHFISSGQRYLHGEAIAVGLITEGYIATKQNHLKREELNEMNQYILKVFGKIEFKRSDIEHIAKLVVQDKKNRGDKILCVLQNGIGSAQWDHEITLEEVKEALNFYQSL